MTVGYNVWNGRGEWCGCVIFGLGANAKIGQFCGLKMGEIIELVRVALNGKQESTSMAVAKSLKRVKQDLPKVRLVVSYADIDQNHLGTIYQATNWIYVGETGKGAPGFYVSVGGAERRKVHPRMLHHIKLNINGYLVPCPQNISAIRTFLDPNAYEVKSRGKRKYLYPLDKKIRNEIEPLSLPYPKTDKDWKKIDRTKYKPTKTEKDEQHE